MVSSEIWFKAREESWKSIGQNVNEPHYKVSRVQQMYFGKHKGIQTKLFTAFIPQCTSRAATLFCLGFLCCFVLEIQIMWACCHDAASSRKVSLLYCQP